MEQVLSVLVAVDTETWLWLGAIAGSAVVALLRLRSKRRAARFARAFDAQLRVPSEARSGADLPQAATAATGVSDVQAGLEPNEVADDETGDIVARLLMVLARGVDLSEAAAQCGMTEDEARVAVACYDPARG